MPRLSEEERQERRSLRVTTSDLTRGDRALLERRAKEGGMTLSQAAAHFITLGMRAPEPSPLDKLKARMDSFHASIPRTGGGK